MKKSDFYYDLPEELIAQIPLEQRDHSRMMCVDRQTGELEHKHFYDIVDLLEPGDLLVMNNSKVLPARLYGTRSTGGSIRRHRRFRFALGKTRRGIGGLIQ